MNRNKYAELLDTVSRQSENISKSIFTKKINHDAHRLAIDCLRLLLTEAELLLKEETAKDLPKCGCGKPAIANWFNTWLCESCEQELHKSVDAVEKHRHRNPEFDGGGGA